MHEHDSRPLAAAAADTFLKMWRCNESAVVDCCRRWLGEHREEVDEAVGRTAMQAFQRCPPRFNDEQHARAWLLALARNICMDMHRERRRRREISLETVLAAPVPVAVFVASSDPERLLLATERSMLLRASIRSLPPPLRRPLILHYFRDMRASDIARTLGIREEAVRKRMELARKQLRKEVTVRRGLRRRALPRDERVLHTIVTTDGAEMMLVGAASDLRPRAIERAERYLLRHPAAVSGRLTLARRLVAAGRFADAVPHYEHVVRKRPYPLAPWLEFGGTLEALGLIPQAALLYAHASLRAGREDDRLHLAARAAFAEGRVEDAIAALQAAIAKAPAAAIHARTLGALLLRIGRIGDAVAMLERAHALDAGDPLTALLLSEARKKNHE